MIEYENLNKSNIDYFPEFKKVFSDVLDSGWFILRQNDEKFEIEFVKYNNVDYCIGAANGFNTLILSLMALDHDPKSEIIVSSNTYIAFPEFNEVLEKPAFACF